MAKTHRNLADDIFDIPQREIGINSKKKGDNNEREACKVLKTWTGERFIRVPSSGGRRLQNASNFCGDVVCENEDFYFPYSVETKHYKKFTFDKKLRSNSKVYTVWTQAIADAVRANKRPMLMLRHNGMKKGSYMMYFDPLVAKALRTLGVWPESCGVYGDTYLEGFRSEDVLKCAYTEFSELLELYCTV